MGWTRAYFNGTTTTNEIFAATSTNNGEAWTASFGVPGASTAVLEKPIALVTDGNSTLFLIWDNSTGLYECLVSENGGFSWTRTHTVPLSSDLRATYFADTAIAVALLDPGRLQVSFYNASTRYFTNEHFIMYNSSINSFSIAASSDKLVRCLLLTQP